MSAPDTLRLITFTPPVVLAVAQARGQLAAEGLRVEHTITRSSAQLMHGVIDGTYDLGFTNPDDNAHAPNETMVLLNYETGLRTICRLWDDLGTMSPQSTV